MFMSTDVYLKRIFHTLEHVIAPEVESDYARGQVFAVISLLEQLAQKIEYRQDLIAQEIKMGSRILKSITSALDQAGAEVPEEFGSFLNEPDSGRVISLAVRNKLEEMLCLAIDLLHDNKGRIEQEQAMELDNQIRDYITKITTRDLGLMKPPAIEKMSRPQKKNK
jgi:hypothetical protein